MDRIEQIFKHYWPEVYYRISEERRKEIINSVTDDGLRERELSERIGSKFNKQEDYIVENHYLYRYLIPHEQTYQQALQEVKNGKKETHWMWWIFPQLQGLGKSERSQFYSFRVRDDADLFLKHPILGQHLIEITEAVYNSDKTPYEIFGNDVIKFRSCMLLFASLKNTNNIFNKVLYKNHWK
jgi:uncharacterized protein (DUF1810 family)